jgi:membrane fusion protein (multidrug efflux system)
MQFLKIGRSLAMASLGVSLLVSIESAAAQQKVDTSIETVKYDGIVQPLRAADISPRHDGLVQKFNFRGGNYVKQGDLLVQLLTVDQDLLLKIDRANLARAKAELQLAEVKLDRSQALHKRNVTSAAELDTAKAERDIAAANRDVAKTQVDIRETTIREFSLYAPFDGVISEPYVNEGAYITLQARKASALATVTQLDPIKVTGLVPFDVYAAGRVYLPTDAAAKARVTLTLILPNGESYPYTGKLTGSGQKFDKTSQRILVSAVFPNPNRLLRPGLRVTVVSTLRQDKSDGHNGAADK